jgi:hypothetical protein
MTDISIGDIYRSRRTDFVYEVQGFEQGLVLLSRQGAETVALKIRSVELNDKYFRMESSVIRHGDIQQVWIESLRALGLPESTDSTQFTQACRDIAASKTQYEEACHQLKLLYKDLGWTTQSDFRLVRQTLQRALIARNGFLQFGRRFDAVLRANGVNPNDNINQKFEQVLFLLSKTLCPGGKLAKT